MSDILQIAVHALLKMKSAIGTTGPKLKIVHQKEPLGDQAIEAYREAILRTQDVLD